MVDLQYNLVDEGSVNIYLEFSGLSTMYDIVKDNMLLNSFNGGYQNRLSYLLSAFLKAVYDNMNCFI